VVQQQSCLGEGHYGGEGPHWALASSYKIIIIIIISGDSNVIKKETEKMLKYKDHTIEIQRMWNVKTR